MRSPRANGERPSPARDGACPEVSTEQDSHSSCADPPDPCGPWRMAPPGRPPPCIELQECVWLAFQKIIFLTIAKPFVLNTEHPESLQVS